MVYRDGGMTIMLILIGAVVLGMASTKLLKLQDDNPVEEAAEAVIEKVTGMDVDLTPASKE